MPQNRQLSAIMFADIVGYTELMQKDEDKALSVVNQYLEVIKANVERFDGAILKYLGDGSLSVFGSVYHAVTCAYEIQKQLKKSTLAVPTKISIHTGEVIYSNDDVYGDGINIASRLQEVALAGSIVYSRDVHEKIRNRPDLNSKFIGQFPFKNVESEIEVFALSNEGLNIPPNQKSDYENQNAGGSQIEVRNAGRKRVVATIFSVFALVALFILYNRIGNNQITNEQLLSSLRNEYDLNSDNVWSIYRKAFDLNERLKGDPYYNEIWYEITVPITMRSNPEGAKVFLKPYDSPDSSWHLLGKTPLLRQRFPKGLYRIKLEKTDYKSQYDVFFTQKAEAIREDSIHYKLFSDSETPDDMVFATGAMGDHSNLAFLPKVYIDNFWIDKFEVTNKDFKVFVDSGGYTNPDYWEFPFNLEGKIISFESAMKRFTDKTGWQGPANWQLGDYEEGFDNIPVSGISWYEANAYAKFADKELPTLYHWYYVSQLQGSPQIVQFSNFDKKRLVDVGSYEGMTRFGTHDLAGNIAEWVFNDNNGKNYIMGGSFMEPEYLYGPMFYAASPWTRDDHIGFRCIKPIMKVATELKDSFNQPTRDYDNLIPVSDEQFDLYRNLLEYEKLALNPKIVSTSENDIGMSQMVNLTVPYDDEPLPVLIFLPKNYKPPYQPVIYFPGLGAHRSTSIDELPVNGVEWFLKIGRAVVWPIYYSTYGRGEINITEVDKWQQSYKYIITDSRIICDYIGSRNDLNENQISYFGISWGGGIAPYILAIEDRIKLGIVALFGVSPIAKYQFKQFDQVDYLPRINIPMLLLGGRYDYDYTMVQQKAFYNLLGTPEADKRWKVYETTHRIPADAMINETRGWLDRYFGPPNSE